MLIYWFSFWRGPHCPPRISSQAVGTAKVSIWGPLLLGSLWLTWLSNFLIPEPLRHLHCSCFKCLLMGNARQYLKHYQNGKSQVLGVCMHTAGTQERRRSVFQMTMAQLSLASLGRHLLVLLTSDPYEFTSGAGFFQNHPKENYQRGLTYLSVCSSWRHRSPTHKQLGPRPLEQREVGQNGP